MSSLTSIRKQQQSWGRRVLGLFVAVWLNLALQPCAMAFEPVDDPDCPNCPPTQVHEHGDMHGNMDGKMPCADGVADCMVVVDLAVDVRGDQFKINDAPSDIAVAIAPRELAAPYPQRTDATLLPRRASVQAGAPPPLHVLHCVYLK